MFFSWQEIHLFPLFISFFIVMFLSFFLLRSGRSDGRWQNTSSRETSENLFLAYFWAWPKVWVDGPESTKEKASADYVWQGLAAIVCFLWLTDLCVWQTARGTPASEDLSSSPHVLSPPLLFSFCWLKTGNLREKLGGKIGQLEAEKLNLEDPFFFGRRVEMSCMQCGWSTTQGRMKHMRLSN